MGENLTRFRIWKNCRRCHSEGVELETQVHAMSTRAGRCKTTYTSPVREQRLTLVSLTLVSACYPLQIRPVLPRPPSACAATPARRGSSSYATRCAFRSAAADLETLVAFSGGERPAAVRLSLSRRARDDGGGRELLVADAARVRATTHQPLTASGGSGASRPPNSVSNARLNAAFGPPPLSHRASKATSTHTRSTSPVK